MLASSTTFCDSMAQALRRQHIPAAVQAVTHARRNYGHLVVDQGSVGLAGIEGMAADITGTCAVALVKSAELAAPEWCADLFRRYCHATVDLDPATGDVLVLPVSQDELEQALAETRRHLAGITGRSDARQYRHLGGITGRSGTRKYRHLGGIAGRSSTRKYRHLAGITGRSDTRKSRMSR